jgi:hypothetical protein
MECIGENITRLSNLSTIFLHGTIASNYHKALLVVLLISQPHELTRSKHFTYHKESIKSNMKLHQLNLSTFKDKLIKQVLHSLSY